MINGRDVLSGIFGAIIVAVLFFVVICIGAVVNKQGIREQVTDWFGVQTTAEELPAPDNADTDNTTNSEDK